MDITIKNSWDEITWREYEQIEQILSADIPASYKSVHLISVLTGMSVDDVELLPITDFQKFLPSLDFLQELPEYHEHKFEHTINGREYSFKGQIHEITTAQYIDYRTYMEREEKDVVELMSVFFIPKGHDYNDGYDMEQVKNDIGDMCWLDIRACSFFFRLWLASYILILKSSLVEEMKKDKKKPRKQLKKEIRELEESFNSSASSLLCSESVRHPLPPSM